MTSAWTPDKTELNEILKDLPSYRVDQLWEGLYSHGTSVKDITALPKSLRTGLSEKLQNNLKELTRISAEDKETVKWLWQLPDEKTIETVLMHYKDRSTVCVSSQAGCAMACGFCATGQAGYERNLTVGEILEQVVAARNAASDFEDSRRLSNIVFMGMGEPFANYNNVLTSVRRIINDFGIGARHITVSTIGLVPQLLKFSEENLQVGLAVSLHAANDTLRSELIPVNKRYPLADLVAACQLYKERTNRRISLEWAMIADTNDSNKDAYELADIASTMHAHVNLIPLNPTPGWPTVGSSPERIKEFCQILKKSGVQVTVRKNKGVDIDAACGQLKATHETLLQIKPTTAKETK